MFIPKTTDMLGIVQDKFLQAENLLSERVSDAASFKQTGCFQTPDGILKMEIPDNESIIGTPLKNHAKVKSELQSIVEAVQTGKSQIDDVRERYDGLRERLKREEWRIDNERPGTLAFFLQHDALFDNYPSLRDIRVNIVDYGDSKTAGHVSDYNSIYSYSRAINIGRKFLNEHEKLHDFFLHEAQHIIQIDNGWSVGGSPQQFEYGSPDNIDNERYELAIKEFSNLDLVDIGKRAVKAAEKMPKGHWGDLRLLLAQHALTKDEKKIISNHALCIKKGQNSHDRYRNMLGEIESYAVVERRKMTNEELRNTLPLMSQKEHLKDMIIGDNFLIDNRFLSLITKEAVRSLTKENELYLTA